MAELPDGAPTAIIYDRVSKDRRGDQRSVTDQDHDNHTACRVHGWRVTGTYVDNHRSASRFATQGRPGWEELLARLEADPPHVLVMWESSRGDRKPIEWLGFLELCRTRRVLIHVTSDEHTYDVHSSLNDWKSLAEQGIGNAVESEKTSQRIRRTVTAAAAAGRPHSQAPWGYRREYDPGTGALVRQVIDDRPRVALASACVAPRTGVLAVTWYAPAEVIRDSARRVLAGETAYAVVGRLNRLGIPTPRRGRHGWTPEQLQQMLLNPAYAGWRVHHGQEVAKATWPPLLDEGDHYRLKALLTAPERRRTREGSVRHLLRGIAVCGAHDCGVVLRVTKSRGKQAYACWSRSPGVGKAFHVSRLEERLDAFVEKVVIARLARPDLAQAQRAAADDADEEMRALLGEIETKRAQLEADIAEALAAGMRPALLTRMDQVRTAEIEALERRVRRVRLSPVVAEIADPDADVVAKRWEALSLAQRREVIRALVERVEVLPAGRGRRSYDDAEVTRIVWVGEEG